MQHVHFFNPIVPKPPVFTCYFWKRGFPNTIQIQVMPRNLALLGENIKIETSQG